MRQVNLVGFDAAHARKQGLSVVTADTIAKTIDGIEIILLAQQSGVPDDPLDLGKNGDQGVGGGGSRL